MKTPLYGIRVFLCLILITVFSLPAIAQKVPIDFNDFHGYTGSVKYMKDVEKAYPDIAELMQIGESNMGRPIFCLIITNKKTGTTIDDYVELRNERKEGVKNVPKMRKYMGKPGHYIDAAIHGNEFTGTEVALYIIDKLVTAYGKDTEITEMIDKNVFYVIPTVNPDGVFNSVERDIPQRQNSMMIDNDGDGVINEDGPDDINGDGHITNFRYKDSNGRFYIDDVDPRYMVRLGRGETTDKELYSVIREDIDNDGDGKTGEDPERGYDMNRNFPEKWFKDDGMPGGTGAYPGATPETRAIMEFFTNHRNILMAQNFHTSGGFTYRPLGTAPTRNMAPKDVAVYDRVLGKKYLELNGLPVPDAWKEMGPLDKFKDELRKTSTNKHAIERGYEMPTGWINGWREEDDRPYSYGMVIDWMYMQYGVYSMTTELWNSRRDMKGIPEFTGDDAQHQRERALLKYQDEEFGGRFFIDWKKYKHPEFGDGEVGGWIPKYRGNNAFPGETLVGVCEIHWQFELFKAKMMPEIVINEASAEVLYTSNNARDAEISVTGDEVTIKSGKSKGKYKVLKVTAKIENIGLHATHLERSASLAGNREDVVWLICDRDKVKFLQGTPFQKIGVLAGTMEIPGTRRPQAAGRFQRQRGQQPAQEEEQTNSGSTREVSWLVEVSGDAPLKIVVTSQKGGTVVKDVIIK